MITFTFLIANLVVLVGFINDFFKNEECGTLRKAGLIYIVVELAIIVIALITFCVLLCMAPDLLGNQFINNSQNLENNEPN